MWNKLRSVDPLVFLPPFLALIAATVLSAVSKDAFLQVITGINQWILAHFSWLFAGGTLFLLLTVVWVYVSPLGRIRIGGEEAHPALTPWRWFSITLCTTVAIDILFWGAAEPLYHLHQPPTSLGITPRSPEAARFALSTMFLHWTFTPYAIYTVPALAFALMRFNRRQPFSLSASLTPLFGSWILGPPGRMVDAICLFALVAGMAASLGTGILTLAGGIATLIPSMGEPAWLRILVAVVIVGTFIASSASGLMRGIRILSDLNTRFFIGLAAFVLIAGPTLFIGASALEAIGEYVLTFPSRSLTTGDLTGDPWPKAWTIFYWANWLAWAPVTAVFLGRISVGYTVRQFIHVNFVATALFSCLWMSIFGGTSLYFDQQTDGALFAQLQTDGPEAMVYAMFAYLPGTTLLTVAFLLAAFLSYVTAADSNTDAMTTLSMRGQSLEGEGISPELKVVWGVTVGLVALIMVSFAGIEGIKALSVLGGFPALFLVLLTAVALLKVSWEVTRNKQSL